MTTKAKQFRKSGLTFLEVGRTGYGPKKENPIYWCSEFRVERKHWCIPQNRWGWQASLGTTRFYGDTLEDIAGRILVAINGGTEPSDCLEEDRSTCEIHGEVSS
jgi:hypothetical protein